MSWQVFDFAAAGTTVIDGANVITGTIDATALKAKSVTANQIQAGAIDTSLLSFTPVTGSAGSLASQVVQAIISSTEPGTLKIQGSRIQIDGSVDFTAGYTSSAQSTAISTAASDATTKAGNAQTAAITTVQNNYGYTADRTQIDGGRIYTNTITAAAIQAGAVTTDKLTVGMVRRENMLTNGHFGTYNTYGDNYRGWSLDGGSFASQNGSYTPGGTSTSLLVPAITATISGGMQLLSQTVSVVPGRTYTVVGMVWHSVGTSGIRVWAAQSGTYPSDTATQAGSIIPAFYQNATLITGGAAASSTPSRWNLYAYRITIPNGVTQVSIQICGWTTGVMTVCPGFIQFYDDDINEAGASLDMVNQLKSVAFGGDLGGSYNAMTVTGLRGRPVGNTAPSTGTALVWDGSNWNANGTVNNATTLGTLALQSAGSAPVANQVLRSDINGYSFFGWINTQSGDNGTAAITRVHASNDTYLRYYTLANFSAQIGANLTELPASIITKPNATWGGQLILGGNGVVSGVATKASVQATDGNLHLDAGVGKTIYLNCYQGGAVCIGSSTVLHSGNYNSYSPTLVGGGASGTWGINISGNSATTDKTSSFSSTPDNTHSGTGMRAFYCCGGVNPGVGNPPASNSYVTGIDVGSNPADQAYGFQLVNPMWQGELWFRTYASGFGTWNRILTNNNWASYCAAASHTHDFATHRAEGTNYIDNSRYVYNDGTYYGTAGWANAATGLGVYYSQLARQVYDDGSYTGNGTAAGWKYADQMGVRYASVAGTTPYASEVNAAFGRTDGTAYPIAWIANNGSKSQLYSCAATTVRSSDGTIFSTHLRGIGNVGGTGEAIHCPAGIYSESTNWLYGQIITASNSITAGSGSVSCGTVYATGDVIAYYSDKRLKENIQPIENALSKVLSLSGVTYTGNALAASHGYTDTRRQLGVIAQEVQKVAPEAVFLAPFDNALDEKGNATNVSISGENYITVKYEKLVPILIEAVKELSAKVEALEAR